MPISIARSLVAWSLGVAASAVVALAVCSTMPTLAANDENPQVGVGATTTLTLEGDPSTGYRWVLDADASENADFVSVKDAGFAARGAEPGQRPVLGAPSSQRFEVTGVAPGEAMLVFRYIRSGEGDAAKTADFLVEVPAASE